MNLMKLLKRLMPLCLAFGCMVMFDSCTEEFCEGLDCGNGTCSQDLGACLCDPGWVDDGIGGKCNVETVCSGIDCGDNGSCQDVDGVATCVCDNGWFGANCQYDNPCDDPDVAPCPENSTCVYQEATDADGNFLVDAEGNPVMEDVCICDAGYSLVDVVDANGEIVDQICGLDFDSFLGSYIQSDTCFTSQMSFGNIPVEVVLDPNNENGIILQGFAGLEGGGHDVKATFNLEEDGDYTFFFTPDNPAVDNTQEVFNGLNTATFESATGTVQTFPNGDIFMTIQYTLVSANSDICEASLFKQ